MKLLIFGASGSGTSTLGREIEKQADFRHLDVDDYYWEKTIPPFVKKIPLPERNRKLKEDFVANENVIVSGSMVSWGTEWLTAFDLAVFIRLDNQIRMERLQKREFERYGDLLVTDLQMKKNSEEFLAWANLYENPDFDGRSLKIHLEWIGSLRAKVIQLDGARSLETNAAIVQEAIKNFKSRKPTLN